MKRSQPSTSYTPRIPFKKSRFEPWQRKSPPVLDPAKDALSFQQTSIEWSMDRNQRPVIRIYGVTEEGNSIQCHVHGFRPYAYFSVPTWFGEEDEELPRFEKLISESLGEDRVVIESYEMVQRCNLFGFNEESTFVKVTLTNPYKLSKLTEVMKGYPIFESNLDFVLRFMIDTSIVGMSWIELPPDSYTIDTQDSSRCQYEVTVSYDRIISHTPEGQYSTIAPLRILSFDIESTGLNR